MNLTTRVTSLTHVGSMVVKPDCLSPIDVIDSNAIVV